MGVKWFHLIFVFFSFYSATLDFGDNILLSGKISSEWLQLPKLRMYIKELESASGIYWIYLIHGFAHLFPKQKKDIWTLDMEITKFEMEMI